MIRNLHARLLKERTPFANAAVCALVIGLGDLIATGTDIFWLIGDMMVQVHPHHYVTMVGLVTAELIMIASFVWLYRSINSYMIKKMNKEINAKEKRNAKRRATRAAAKQVNLSVTSR